jgi:hypothetical protein
MMKTLFSRIQCLPVAFKFTSNERGKVWSKETSSDRISMVTNPHYYKVEEVRGSWRRTNGNQQHVNKKPQDLRNSMMKNLGVQEVVQREEEINRQREKRRNNTRSAKSQDKRQPPP